MNFTVSTDRFRGPVDLLLFLVRRHELDVAQIPLSAIAQQFNEYLQVLKVIDIDSVGDFIEVASALVEMKSRLVLPQIEAEDQEPYMDPRADLVHRLLLFKRFRDAADLLEEQSLRWQRRFCRMADDLPTQRIDYAQQPLEDIELWDLVSAFGRILRENLPKTEESIVYDETPIQIYMQQIHTRLRNEGQVRFMTLFVPGMHKSAMVGIFLAVLELTRHYGVIAKQGDAHSEIIIQPGGSFQPDAEFRDIDSYSGRPMKPGDPASLVP